MAYLQNAWQVFHELFLFTVVWGGSELGLGHQAHITASCKLSLCCSLEKLSIEVAGFL